MSSSKEIIIDSGFFIALFSKTDQFHKKALGLRDQIGQKKWVTTWPVLTEVCHLLSSRGSAHYIPNLFKVFENDGFDLYPLTKNHVQQILFAFEKYRNLRMDLADASLIILAQELGHGNIVSTDVRDFDTYRWKNHKPFHNLFK